MDSHEENILYQQIEISPEIIYLLIEYGNEEKILKLIFYSENSDDEIFQGFLQSSMAYS